jgi:glycerol uptake facilitator protein
MSPFAGELFGTMLLVVFGDGVVANVVLGRTKGHDSGWIVIATGWAVAVTLGVYAANAASGAHLNPAVTLALASVGTFPWANVPLYVVAQLIGAFLGGVVVWLAYLPHWRLTPDPAAKLAVFCTGPAVRQPGANILSEAIGTAALTIGLLVVLTPANLVPNSGFDKALAPLLVGVLVWGIGLSLGGSTGYAINPARDLGPRLAHSVLPIPGKGSADWSYAWIPVVGPIIGGVAGALLHAALLAG